MARGEKERSGHIKDYIRLIIPGPVYEYRPPKENPFPRWSQGKKEAADASERRPEKKVMGSE